MKVGLSIIKVHQLATFADGTWYVDVYLQSETTYFINC